MALKAFTYQELLAKQPMELLSLFEKEVKFPVLKKLEDKEDYDKALEMLNKSSAYVCYFKALETAARIQKREAKRRKDNPVEVDRCMGVEEVFETFKRVSEQKYDTIVKIFTSKRLLFDEYKVTGRTT